VLRGLNWKTVLAFFDDILVLGKTFDDHFQNLEEELQRFRKYGLKLKPKKCILFQHEVEILGRIASNDRLSMAEKDIKVVQNWETPQCSKDVQRFMGLVNYHRMFVKNFAEMSEPLYRNVGKDKFKWEEEQQNAFDVLKKTLISQPVLALPNNHDEFVLDRDASNIAVAAELLQIQKGQEKVVAYGSYILTPEQQNYCVTRRELLAVVRFTRQYEDCLLGKDVDCLFGKDEDCLLGNKEDCLLGNGEDCLVGNKEDCLVGDTDDCLVGNKEEDELRKEKGRLLAW
jgi:hypothetical protein